MKNDSVTFKNNQSKSLDELERESFHAKQTPFSGIMKEICLDKNQEAPKHAQPAFSLNGIWQMTSEENGNLNGDFTQSIDAVVPGSIHSALVSAGELPDLTFGRNQELGCKESYKSWWLKREFIFPENIVSPVLSFAGICNRCDIWLNGIHIASHEGMFGGPEIPVDASFLKENNVLVVKLHAIPYEPDNDPENEILSHEGNNGSWRHTVVFNNVYGWHYSQMPSLGIWAPVTVYDNAVRIVDPFIATEDAQSGQVKLVLGLRGGKGKLKAVITPENFDGNSYSFQDNVDSESCRYAFSIPEHQLWWPVDFGKPNLYRLHLSFMADNGSSDEKDIVFGIRNITTAPLPDGPSPDKYNWTFVVNGKSKFIKGSGWCTMDALMDFSRERYDRFLSLCRDQHVQMLRAWGSGMPETFDFYDLCDRYGIMVIQEWPTAWNSHETQPYDMLEETVIQNTLRLRNHASLVMWGGGNESSKPFGKAIDMMGRYSIELDGTRPFHRGEPWGGSQHDYKCWWGYHHLDYNLNMTAEFYGEFGVACSPCYESLMRYLPDEEKDIWPPIDNGAFAYHTPVFNTVNDVNRLMQYAGYFVPVKHCTLEEYTIASQLASATALRHPLERARTRWPDASGALYYKINDNFPAASWACIDWYGTPKLSYYFVRDAFKPLRAIVLFNRTGFAGTPQSLPVWVLDDNKELEGKDWTVNVRLYNGSFEVVKAFTHSAHGSIESPYQLGFVELNWEESSHTPLLTVAEVLVDEKILSRSFYWSNFEYDKGCLFHLPKASLKLTISDNFAIIENSGNVPAVGVVLQCKEFSDKFEASDNCFWLEAGERREIAVNITKPLEVSAFNFISDHESTLR